MNLKLKYRCKCLLLSLTLFAPMLEASVLPQATDGCEGATFSRLKECAADAVAESKANLNKAYSVLHAKLGADESERMDATQKKWLEYRKLDCSGHPENDGIDFLQCLYVNNMLRAGVLVDHYESAFGETPDLDATAASGNNTPKPHPDMAECSETEAIEAMIKRIQEGSPGATQGIRYVRIVDIEPYARDGESITCRFSAWVNAGGKVPMTLKQILANGEPMGLLEPIWDEIELD